MRTRVGDERPERETVMEWMRWYFMLCMGLYGISKHLFFSSPARFVYASASNSLSVAAFFFSNRRRLQTHMWMRHPNCATETVVIKAFV